MERGMEKREAEKDWEKKALELYRERLSCRPRPRCLHAVAWGVKGHRQVFSICHYREL